MLFSFESFCTKVKKCSDEIFRYVVYGSWRGNVIPSFIIAVIATIIDSIIFNKHFVLYIIFYFIILITLMLYILTRRVGFAMNKDKFLYVRFSHLFYKPKKVLLIPFDKIKYLKVVSLLGARIITLSFLNDQGKIERIKFSYNKIVVGLSVTEQRRNALEISKKLFEIQKVLDRGDF